MFLLFRETLTSVTNSAVERVRTLCLSLPGAELKPFGDHTAPGFRVRDKIFCEVGHDLTVIRFKAGAGVQEALVGSDPQRFSVPKYVGHRGWVEARIDRDPDWDELAGLIQDSYRLIAPKRLVAELDWSSR